MRKVIIANTAQPPWKRTPAATTKLPGIGPMAARSKTSGSEKLIGGVIAGQRGGVFLVSKVWPTHVTWNGIARACEASLARLGTNYLDLYLLHWPQGVTNFADVVADFESLRAAGKIRAWGVSNFNVSDMEDLFRVPYGDRCATNQVLYNVGGRDIEHDLLPWCERRGMPVMAYTPLGGNGVRDPTIARISAAHGCSAAAVALAWTTRSGNVIAIPESQSYAGASVRTTEARHPTRRNVSE